MSTFFKLIIDYHEAFLSGIGMTFKMCAIIWTIGLLLGGLLGILASKHVPLKRVIGMTHHLLLGLPALVLLYWFHYPLQAALKVVIDPFFTAILTFSIYNIFSVAKLTEETLSEFPKSYLQAAKVCGISDKQVLIKIQTPLLLRQMLPSLIQLQVNVLHMTLFAGFISVDEIFRVSQQINSVVYRPIEIYTTLALLILMISLLMTKLANQLKRKLSFNFSYL